MTNEMGRKYHEMTNGKWKMENGKWKMEMIRSQNTVVARG